MMEASITSLRRTKRSFGISPEIGKKASPTTNPENLLVGMPVKTKPIGSAGNRMLEPCDEELLARRHLRTVSRERVDWHISRRNHGRHYRVYLSELSGNYASCSVAGLCQGAFRSSEQRRMVLSFCRGMWSIHALKRRGFRDLKVLQPEMQP
jgi:hypothetical protein